MRELLGAVRDEVEAALGGRGELPRGVRLEAEKVTVCLTLSPGRTPSGALTVAATAQDPVPGMGTVQVEFRVCRELEVVVAAPPVSPTAPPAASAKEAQEEGIAEACVQVFGPPGFEIGRAHV